MGESLVQVTEGTGKKLHTWQRTVGSNNVEDEYVLLGENAQASYVIAPGGDISCATANSHLLQIMAGSTNRVRIRRIEIHQSTLATTAAICPIFIYRLTTAGTGGSAQTPQQLDPADAASGFTAMVLPTVKGTEAASPIWAGTAYMIQTAGASTQNVQPVAVIDWDRPRSKPLIISAGTTNGIAVKWVNATAAANVRISVWADEATYA